MSNNLQRLRSNAAENSHVDDGSDQLLEDDVDVAPGQLQPSRSLGPTHVQPAAGAAAPPAASSPLQQLHGSEEDNDQSMDGADAPRRGKTAYERASKYTTAQITRLVNALCTVMAAISGRFGPLAASGDARIVTGGTPVAGLFLVHPCRSKEPLLVLLDGGTLPEEEHGKVLAALASCAHLVRTVSAKEQALQTVHQATAANSDSAPADLALGSVGAPTAAARAATAATAVAGGAAATAAGVARAGSAGAARTGGGRASSSSSRKGQQAEGEEDETEPSERSVAQLADLEPSKLKQYTVRRIQRALGDKMPPPEGLCNSGHPPASAADRAGWNVVGGQCGCGGSCAAGRTSLALSVELPLISFGRRSAPSALYEGWISWAQQQQELHGPDWLEGRLQPELAKYEQAKTMHHDAVAARQRKRKEERQAHGSASLLPAPPGAPPASAGPSASGLAAGGPGAAGTSGAPAAAVDPSSAPEVPSSSVPRQAVLLPLFQVPASTAAHPEAAAADVGGDGGSSSSSVAGRTGPPAHEASAAGLPGHEGAPAAPADADAPTTSVAAGQAVLPLQRRGGAKRGRGRGGAGKAAGVRAGRRRKPDAAAAHLAAVHGAPSLLGSALLGGAGSLATAGAVQHSDTSGGNVLPRSILRRKRPAPDPLQPASRRVRWEDGPADAAAGAGEEAGRGKAAAADTAAAAEGEAPDSSRLQGEIRGMFLEAGGAPSDGELQHEEWRERCALEQQQQMELGPQGFAAIRNEGVDPAVLAAVNQAQPPLAATSQNAQAPSFCSMTRGGAGEAAAGTGNTSWAPFGWASGWLGGFSSSRPDTSSPSLHGHGNR